MTPSPHWTITPGTGYLLLISGEYEVRATLFICDGDPIYDMAHRSTIKGKGRIGIPRFFKLTDEETYKHIIFEAVGENV